VVGDADAVCSQMVAEDRKFRGPVFVDHAARARGRCWEARQGDWGMVLQQITKPFTPTQKV